MTLYFVPGRGIVDDAEEQIPLYGSLTLPDGSLIEWGDKGVEQLGTYYNRAQFGGENPFHWSSQGLGGRPLNLDYATGYIPDLFDLRDKVNSGQATPYEREYYQQQVQEAMAIPGRDIGQLVYGSGENPFDLHGGSPDLGRTLLSIRDRMDRGEASDQERQLYTTTTNALREQNIKASVPQASDVAFGLGDNLFGALLTVGLGATGGLAAAPLAAGGASLATTLGSLGTLSGIAGTGAGILGSAIDAPWLQKLGLGLGIAGGLAGGIGGLSNVFGSGVRTLGDAAKLASSAGKITGALGRIPGADPLKQASRYLGLAGQLGSAGSGVQNLFGAAQGVTQGATEGATQAVTQAATQAATGGQDMADFSYEDFIGWGDPYGPGSSGDFEQAYADFLGWGGDETQQGWYQGADLDTSGGGSSWLSSVLGGLGSVGSFLGKNASWLGPAASGLTSLATGASGANASTEAAALQSQYLNRGLDLQTAQWLQQQANQAPWLEAGRLALGDLTGRAQWAQPTLQQVAPISGANYALPSATPGWAPQSYAGYTPTEVPGAAGYAYRPGQVPGAADYRYRPGAVPTLSGAELLANDPGVQFRLDEGRRALEASAAARGGALSGPALAALQRQGQELSSNEYANAWQRAAHQAQMREGWAQTASQLGFGQAMSEAQLREQLAQQAGAQNWQQALQEAQARAQQQQFGWQAGMQAQQAGQQERRAYDTELYQRMMGLNQLQYGRDWQQREAENQRLMDAYNALRQGDTTAWNRFASLAGLGQTALGQLGTAGQNITNQQANLLGQIGSAQGIGTLGSAANWQRGIGGLTNNVTDFLAGLNR